MGGPGERLRLAAQVQGLQVVVFGFFGLKEAWEHVENAVAEQQAEAHTEGAVFEARVTEGGSREDQKYERSERDEMTDRPGVVGWTRGGRRGFHGGMLTAGVCAADESFSGNRVGAV